MNFMPAALPRPRSPRTVLLRMAADQDRAERIKKLKRDRPDLKWRVIAERVGVTERAAASWAQNGGIAYDNAKKLAELFEVDVDYIMRGNPTAPDLFGHAEQFDTVGIEDRLDRIERAVEALAEAVRDQRIDNEQALADQTAVLDIIKGILSAEVTGEDDAPARVVEAVRDAAARAGARREPAPQASRTHR